MSEGMLIAIIVGAVVAVTIVLSLIGNKDDTSSNKDEPHKPPEKRGLFW